MNIAGGSIYSAGVSSHNDLTDIGTNNHATIDAFINSKAQAGGLAPLDGSLKVPLTHLPTSSNIFKGLWNANSNTPPLLTGGVGGITGDYYIVNVAGNTLIDGVNTWDVGDWIIHTGAIWERIDNPDPELVDLGTEYKTLKDQPIKNNTAPTDPKHLTPKDYVDNITIDHNNLLNKGTNTHAQIDAHISDDSKHRLINDVGNSLTDLFSAEKILNIQTNLQGQITTNDNDILALQNKTQKLNTSGDASAKINYASAQTFTGPLEIVSKDYVDSKTSAIQGALRYCGVYDASTNTPNLISAGPYPEGCYHIVSVAGTPNLNGTGNIDLKVGDWVVRSPTKWEVIDNTDQSSSVANLELKAQYLNTNGQYTNDFLPSSNGAYPLGSDVLKWSQAFVLDDVNCDRTILNKIWRTGGSQGVEFLSGAGVPVKFTGSDYSAGLDRGIITVDTATVGEQGKLKKNSVASLSDAGDLKINGGELVKTTFTNDQELITKKYVDDATAGSSGYVVGPGAATDDAICRYNLTTGKLIQNSTVSLTDTGAINNVLSIEPTANENVAYGLGSNNTGSTNISLGTNSGTGNTGSFNVMIGRGTKNNSGGENIIIGDGAGSSALTGVQNICIGSSSGSNNLTSNNECIFIGRGFNNIGTGGLNNMICLGNGITKRANEVVIGGTGTTTTHIRANGDNHCDLGYFDGMANNSQFKNLYLSGDIYVNGIRMLLTPAPAANPYLDGLTFAANLRIVCALSKLLTSYAGPCLRVRRASDNSELDINFDAIGYVDKNQLSGFISGTQGFIVRWYDQSGNTNNMENTTTSEQPQLLIGTNNDAVNEVRIKYDGVDDLLKSDQGVNAINNLGLTTGSSYAIRFSSTTTANQGVISNNTNTDIDFSHSIINSATAYQGNHRGGFVNCAPFSSLADGNPHSYIQECKSTNNPNNLVGNVNLNRTDRTGQIVVWSR